METESKTKETNENPQAAPLSAVDSAEEREWVESLEEVLEAEGPEATRHLLGLLLHTAQRRGVALQFATSTPYVNTIAREQ